MELGSKLYVCDVLKCQKASYLCDETWRADGRRQIIGFSKKVAATGPSNTGFLKSIIECRKYKCIRNKQYQTIFYFLLKRFDWAVL